MYHETEGALTAGLLHNQHCSALCYALGEYIPDSKGAGIVDLAYDEYLLDQGKGSKSITVIVLALATETKQNATREENCMVRSRQGDELVVQLKD